MKLYFYILIALIFTHLAVAQVPKPAGPQAGPILIFNGTIHVGNGTVINDGAIGFDKGKITFVGDITRLTIDTSSYKLIDIQGKHIYPGLILPTTRLGLEEVSALRPTRDFAEVGSFNPNVRSLTSFNTDSELIATMRYNGILLAQSTPTSGVVSGTSSIMALDGWNWEDAAYSADDGIHLRWPPKFVGGTFFNPEKKANVNYEKVTRSIEDFLADAQSYHQTDDPETVNLKMESMKGIFSGDKTLYVHASAAMEILEALQTIGKYAPRKVVLVGGYDAYYVRDYLKEHEIPVILGNMHRLPSRAEEDIDMPYKLPYLLSSEGILVGLAYNRSLQSSRNLPFHAGTASAYGLSREEALSLVTLNTAKILGIDDKAGSLEVGKDAHIVVSEGDLLDMRTSRVSLAFIMGKTLELEGKQERLYQRFKDKYEKQGY